MSSYLASERSISPATTTNSSLSTVITCGDSAAAPNGASIVGKDLCFVLEATSLTVNRISNAIDDSIEFDAPLIGIPRGYWEKPWFNEVMGEILMETEDRLKAFYVAPRNTVPAGQFTFWRATQSLYDQLIGRIHSDHLRMTIRGPIPHIVDPDILIKLYQLARPFVLAELGRPGGGTQDAPALVQSVEAALRKKS